VYNIGTNFTKKVIAMNCPTCQSENIIKKGSIHNGKQKYACKDCHRQFVLEPENGISIDTKELIDKLLLEKIPLAGIARAVEVSERWLQDYVTEKYDAIKTEIDVTLKKKGKITLQCDEMWSFVMSKENKQWIWLAIDIETREIVGAFIGSRDKKGAQGLWDSLPPVYRQCAVSYTDFWKAYDAIFPKKRHKSVGKETGLTNRIERFNCTMRQGISRLVRKTLSFSKKLSNHIGAIWYFIHYYNANIN
jgi:insertion element IS1 protein InsB